MNELTSSSYLILLNMGGTNDLSEVKVFLNNMFNDHPLFVQTLANLYRSMSS